VIAVERANQAGRLKEYGAAEAPQLPLRVPIGPAAAEILASRRAAPDDRPFIPGASTAVRS
jgi:hypothetical protein